LRLEEVGGRVVRARKAWGGGGCCRDAEKRGGNDVEDGIRVGIGPVRDDVMTGRGSSQGG